MMTQNLTILFYLLFSPLCLNLESFFKILIANDVKIYPFSALGVSLLLFVHKLWIHLN